MKLEEIQNPALKKLIGDLKHASSTIENDFNDALEKSSTEKELIEYWQSALKDLQNECGAYWENLEKIKTSSEPRQKTKLNIKALKTVKFSDQGKDPRSLRY